MEVPTVSKNGFGDSLGATIAVKESNVENLHSQQTNAAAHLESTKLVDSKSTPVYEGIQNLNCGCNLTNLAGPGTSYVVPGKV